VAQARTLTANFTIVTRKMWAAPKIAKIGNFWYKFAQNGIPP